MSLATVLTDLHESAPFVKARKSVESGKGHIEVHGLAGSLSACLLANLRQELKNQMVAVVSRTDDAERLRDDLETLLGEGRVKYMPDWELLPHEEKSPHVEVTGLRIEALHALVNGEPVVVVTTGRALARPTLAPETLGGACLPLRLGDEISPDAVVKRLRELCFERESQVQEMGQFAVRGGILDIFSFGRERPVRIEFFGDEIDSIREFESATQRSSNILQEVEILPRRELLFDLDSLDDWETNLRMVEEEYGADLGELREQVELGVHFQGAEGWMSVITGEHSSLFSYLNDDALIMVDDIEAVAGQVDHLFDEAERIASRKAENGEPLPDVPLELLHHSWSSLKAQMDRILLLELRDVVPGGDHIEFGAGAARDYEGDLDVLRDDLTRFKGEGGRSVIVCDNKAQGERLFELLEDVSDLMEIEVSGLHAGFTYPAAGVQLITDHELFSRYRRRHRYRKYKGAVAVNDYLTLVSGDIMVHEDHGIGVFRGLQTLKVSGLDRDCLEVAYRDDDRLFLPADQISRIKKYMASDERAPVLSKLGGSDWDRLKEKTKKAVEEVAQDLVGLYARRATEPGFAFSPDTSMQNAMEDAFMYEETRDQAAAIEDVRKDMEQPLPMDRLICGDVGFGKTEVAMRAAFKAVMDHKQVAVLVPTTVLAFQHWRVFCERMAEFPVRVEQLSRFRTPKQQELTLHDLANGKVDIVIGTHRILSKDVEFADLGLAIIDEEHRFGVKHKEKLKSMRNSVDVMTLTATPIPRTLQMALMGVRDMSVISTPPRDRLPVATEVIDFDEDRIAEAILREVDRGGQTFFLHNRVATIEEQAEWLRGVVPGVKFKVAHGQMGERRLEKVMLDFAEEKFDCLVTTMIIQSGLDMPNVNTIIIDRADTFGLAELYQLRGRVGRSDHRAFAYLMVPPKRKITPQSRKRLRAIEEYSDLGSGFKVAMRDLEIRGAGNMLGHAQSGLITSVGIEMYTKLLEEAVAELKGDHSATSTPVTEVDVAISAYIPDSFVADPEQKMEMYQKLAHAKNVGDVSEIAHELRDRYGRLPEVVETLLGMTEIKVLGQMMGASSVNVDKNALHITFPDGDGLNSGELMEIVGRAPGNMAFRTLGQLSALMPLTSGAIATNLRESVDIMKTMNGVEGSGVEITIDDGRIPALAEGS